MFPEPKNMFCQNQDKQGILFLFRSSDIPNNFEMLPYFTSEAFLFLFCNLIFIIFFYIFVKTMFSLDSPYAIRY